MLFIQSSAALTSALLLGLSLSRTLNSGARANNSLAPLMTSAGALIDGLETMGAKRVSIMAPYMRPLTDLVVKYIEHEGIEVIDSICFEIPDNLEVGRRDSMLLLDDVR